MDGENCEASSVADSLRLLSYQPSALVDQRPLSQAREAARARHDHPPAE